MMENGMSVADVAALSNNDGFGGTGGWLWFLIVMFAIFNGGFGFGGNQQYATSADVQRSTDQVETSARFNDLFSNQARNAMDNLSLIDRNALDNANLINQNRYDNAMLINQLNTTNMQNSFTQTNAMNQGFNGIDKSICQSTWATTQAMNDGFAGVNQAICGLSHQISDGVCAIKTQMLQDKYDKLLNDYNLSTMANANSVQTQNILGAIGSWYAKPPYAPIYGTTIA